MSLLMKCMLYSRFSVFAIRMVFLVAGVFPGRISAQGWIQNFGVPGRSWHGEEVEKLADGGYIIGGQTELSHNALIARLDQSGDTLWTRLFPGANPWGEMLLQDMEIDVNGMTHIILLNLSDWWASYACLDIMGNIVEEFFIYPTALDEYLLSLCVLDDGIVFAGAKSETDSTTLTKRAFNGDLIWTSSLPTLGGVVEIQQDTVGNFVLLVEVDNYDYEIVKADPIGQFLWRVPVPGSVYRGSVTIQPDGNVVSASETDTQIQLFQLSPDGNILNVIHDNIFPNKGKTIERIISDMEGNLYVTGKVVIVPTNDNELLIVKYNPSLARIGYNSYDEGENFWTAKDLELTNNNGLVFCGTRTIVSNTGSNTNLICVFNIPIDALTDTKEPKDQRLCKIQPNPVDNYLSFMLEKYAPGLKTLIIYSTDGKLIRIEEFYETNCHIIATDLPVGLLFYSILQDGQIFMSGQFVKN